MKILVVDDDALACEMTAAIVESAGHQVWMAEQGMDALEQLGNTPEIDLIISDMNMPLLSGIDLFRELRSMGMTQPFILLTGDDPEQLRAAEPALDGCMMKDFAMEETLPQLINTVMSTHHHAGASAQ